MKTPCAVLGATGAVGQRFIERLVGHPEFDIVSLVGNRSAGHTYGEATNWILDGDVPEEVAGMRIESMQEFEARSDVRVAFSALPGGDAGPIEARLAQAGLAVFTNAKDHRMDAAVPLLIPEVNPDHLELAKRQGPGFIVANGNCSAIVLTLALAPIHRAFGLAELDVTTMQGLSGAGYPGVSALDAIDNLVPYIGGEEDKLETEPQKTLGTMDAPADFVVWPTCTRAPVREGHFETVHARLRTPASAEALVEAFASFRGPEAVQKLHTAPKRPIHVMPQQDRPQPRRDRDIEGGMAVSVGRIRVEKDGLRVRFVVLGHNTVRGAAGQSVLNAEFAKAQGLL